MNSSLQLDPRAGFRASPICVPKPTPLPSSTIELLLGFAGESTVTSSELWRGGRVAACPVSGEMLDEVFVHLEHAHLALAAEDILELVIRRISLLLLGFWGLLALMYSHTMLTTSVRGSGELN